MDRYTVVYIAIGIIIGFFGFLLVLIAAMKLRRQIREMRFRKRRAVLEPMVLAYASARSGTLQQKLGQEPKRFDLEVLERILLEHVGAVRGAMRDRLIEAFEDLGLIARHVEALTSRRTWVRGEAAERLGRMRSPRAERALVQAMDDPAPEVRLRAAQALGALGGRAAVSKLVSALQEPSRWSAMRVAAILTAMGEQAVDELLPELPRLPDQGRLLVIDIFGRVKSLQAIPVLRDLLRDDNRDIRARAANALGRIGDPGSVESLVPALRDEEWPVRAMAAKALGRIPGADAVPALCDALTDGQWWVRANAAEALKGKGEEGHRALVGVLESSDGYAREQAVLMLQESGVLDSYVSKLCSGDKGERDRAVNLIAKLVRLKRTDLLRQIATEHTDPEIRRNLSLLLGISPQPAGSS